MEPRDTTLSNDRKRRWTDKKWAKAAGWVLVLVAALFPFPGTW